MYELEAELLKGQSAQGPLTAAELYDVIKTRDLLKMFVYSLILIYFNSGWDQMSFFKIFGFRNFFGNFLLKKGSYCELRS